MGWNDDQARAINARSCNLLVSAAAGSGKTAVLVERIIGILMQDGIDIDRLLVVTFTQAAAAEMRSRISRTLIEALGQPNGEEAGLRHQLNLLGHASISTIHSFCTDVVKSHFHLVDIDPHFRIADATESELLKLEVVEELMEGEYEKADPLFLGLVERFGSSRSDQGLQDLILKTFSFIQSQPQPLVWLKEKVDNFQMKDATDNRPLLTVLKTQLNLQLCAARDRFLEALAICTSPGGPIAYYDAIANDISNVESLLVMAGSDINDLYTALHEIAHMKLKPVNKDANPEITKQAKELRDEGKYLIQEILNDIIFKSPAALSNDMNQIYPYLSYLSSLVADFSQAFRVKKAEKNLLDFNDLEHYALEILSNEEVRQEYRRRFDYVFVDEYQDSNLVQETIINSIKREDNLFLVGDVKQSIYRFRLADPTLFLDKQASYSSDECAGDRRIDLKNNYRSREEIINGVNYIFKTIMSRDLGEIDYDELAELRLGVESPAMEESALEFCLIEKNQEVVVGDQEDVPLDHIQVEAELVGKRIRQLVQQEIWDAKQGCYRCPDYRDIVILLRATRRWAPVFTESLMAQGIPVYADTGTGYFASVEVSVFLNLLRLIDNRCQDIPLLSVMRSPLADFSLDDMIIVRAESRDLPFYQAVETYIKNNNDELATRLKTFSEALAGWQEKSRWMPLNDFLWKLLIDTGYYYYAGAMPGGEQRQANLRILVDRARQFEESSLRGLFQFLKFVERIQVGTGDMGMAKILGENDNVVRIMSIHKSKGLEFPVVIVAGLGQQFNLGDSNDSMLFHRDLGLGPRFVNPETRTITDTIARVILRRKIRLESLSEEMRILYVAMTRAEAKLILVGTSADLAQRCRKWCQTPGPYTLARGRHFLDWLGPALIRHPDGEILRELAEVNIETFELVSDPSCWRVRVMDPRQPYNAEPEDAEAKNIYRFRLQGKVKVQPSCEAEEIQRRLNWQYPYLTAETIPSKLSVTQIIKFNHDVAASDWLPVLRARPSFLAGAASLGAADKGSIAHMVMQHLDLKSSLSAEDIKRQVAEMVEREIIRAEEAAVVNPVTIQSFFMSPLGQRALAAEKCCREKPFNLAYSADELLPSIDTGEEKLMVQGVIDLYFEEEDGIVLVDYKTGYVSPEADEGYHSREKAIERYRPQIAVYRQALQNILGARVKESYIYLFATEEAILID